MTATNEKTKIQRGIDYIHKHPNCRTDDLAEVMSCDSRSVYATLWPALQAGLVISCKVERPGQRAVNEFRLSAASPDGKAPIWPAWKAGNAHLAPKKHGAPALPSAAYKDTTRKNVEQTPAGRGANNTGSRESGTSIAEKKPEVAAVVEQRTADDSPLSAGSDEKGKHYVPDVFARNEFLFELKNPPFTDDDTDPQAFQRARRLVCSASTDGQVTIARKGETGLALTADEAHMLYAFLGDAARIWGKAIA